MKKSILAVAGVAAFAGVAMPVAGAFATDPSDTINVTIDSSCTLSYDTTAHAAGTVATNKWTSNKLTAKIANGAADTNIGSTTMRVVCNDLGGYHVDLTATALTGQGDISTQSIPYIADASAPTSSTSAWGVSTGSTPTWILNAGTVYNSTSATAGQTFTVTYGVSASSTQAAGTYEGTASYTVTHPGKTS